MELQATQDFRLVFLKPVKCSTGALTLPPHPSSLTSGRHKRACLHGENEGHYLIKLPVGGRAVIVKLSVFILIK